MRERFERLGREGRQQPRPGVVDSRTARRWLRYVAPLSRVAFRPRLEGIDELPRAGPFLLVANHSGLGLADITCLIVVWLQSFGTSRPLAGMVHPVSFNAWPMRAWMLHLGAIPSTYEAALGALASQTPVVVFPGGDIDASRPIWWANRVLFGERKGFLKIACKAHVPIVPLGIRGSHYTAPILFRSQWLGRALVLPWLVGNKRFPVTLLGAIGVAVLLCASYRLGWPLAAVLAWLWLCLPLAHIPWIPWTVRMRVGKALMPESLFDDVGLEGDADLTRAQRKVVAAIERLVRE